MVYVVSDYRSLSGSLQRYFSSIEQPSQFFESGEQFLDFLCAPTNAEDAPTFCPAEDILIIDFLLPQMSGQDLVKAISDYFRTTELNVIFMSGYTKESISSEAEGDFDADFLLKPFTLEALEYSMLRIRNRITDG